MDLYLFSEMQAPRINIGCNELGALEGVKVEVIDTSFADNGDKV